MSYGYGGGGGGGGGDIGIVLLLAVAVFGGISVMAALGIGAWVIFGKKKKKEKDDKDDDDEKVTYIYTKAEDKKYDVSGNIIIYQYVYQNKSTDASSNLGGGGGGGDKPGGNQVVVVNQPVLLSFYDPKNSGAPWHLAFDGTGKATPVRAATAATGVERVATGASASGLIMLREVAGAKKRCLTITGTGDQAMVALQDCGAAGKDQEFVQGLAAPGQGLPRTVQYLRRKGVDGKCIMIEKNSSSITKTIVDKGCTKDGVLPSGSGALRLSVL